MTPVDAPRRRRRAAAISLGVGVAIFIAKIVAWRLTGSTALLADALESIVNIVAALFAVVAVRLAAQPPDRDHPYGHGKIELLSAAFEGGLVTFAALLSGVAGVRALVAGPSLRSLDRGLLVTAAAGVANLLLGLYLVRTGRAAASPSLEADGHHVLSDVWTTIGVLAGLLLVRLTGFAWLDPVTALLVGLLLLRTGARLVARAVDGLLDREDPTLLAKLVDAFNAVRVPGLTRLHRLRAIRSGDVVHVDAHVFAPEHWSVAEAHEAARRLEQEVQARTGIAFEIALHLDPCRSLPCSRCELPACPIRQRPFSEAGPLTIDEAVGGAGLPGHEPPAR